ncbi:hypothetical protein FGADI_754 [Fusarium gaditjirri]|uniref:Uncharacterized protein n=1 Tax=Fusarium gaditjirri TaxID=282569 RepID=A0A8H4TML2_9HYPO|nr:hypothetical protein FGADI_754 [Fusarium gaditjirri]
MGLFDILADAVEDAGNLGAETVDLAHRTHNGVLDSIVYNTNEQLVRGAGHAGASILRGMGSPDGDGLGRQNEVVETMEDIGEEEGDLEVLSGDCLGHTGPYRDVDDHRDYIFLQVHGPLRPRIDLRDDFPEVYNQGDMMSCVANAVAAGFQFCLKSNNLTMFMPSRMFIWYNARALSQNRGDVKKNVGCNIRMAVQSLQKRGVCSEQDWPYILGGFDDKTRIFDPGAWPAQPPSPAAKMHAHQHIATQYWRIKDDANLLRKLRACLDKHRPFIFGMHTRGLLHTKEMRQSGRALADKPRKQDLIKRKPAEEHDHTLLAVGYDDEHKLFILSGPSLLGSSPLRPSNNRSFITLLAAYISLGTYSTDV